jgi:hypothetical protein
MSFVFSKSVWGRNSCNIYNHCVNVIFFYAWVIRKLLSLWRGYDLAECTGAIHTPWADATINSDEKKEYKEEEEAYSRRGGGPRRRHTRMRRRRTRMRRRHKRRRRRRTGGEE